MTNLNTAMYLVLLIGIITVIVCVFALIHDCRKQRMEDREHRRKHLSENTAKTILAYRSRQETAASCYRRRA